MGCQGSKAAVPTNASVSEETTKKEVNATEEEKTNVQKEDSKLVTSSQPEKKSKPSKQSERRDSKPSQQSERRDSKPSQPGKETDSQLPDITEKTNLKSPKQENESNACALNCNAYTTNDETRNLQTLSNNFSSNDFFCMNGHSDDVAGFREEILTRCSVMYSTDKACRIIDNDDCMGSPTIGLQSSVNASMGDEQDGASLSIGLPSETHIENLTEGAVNRQSDNRCCQILPEKTTAAEKVKTNTNTSIPYNIPEESRQSSVSTPEPTSDEEKIVAPFSCINNGNKIIRSHISSRLNDPHDLKDAEKR